MTTLPPNYHRLSSKWLETNVAPEDLICRYIGISNCVWIDSDFRGRMVDHEEMAEFEYATARTDLPREAYADDEIRPMTAEERKALDEFTMKELTESNPTPDLTQAELPKAGLAQHGAEVASERAEDQATTCGKCGEHKHTPWRDSEYGYVCLKCLAEGFANNPKLAAEIAAWREYYMAGVVLDDLDYTHPKHAEAVDRVVRSVEALTPLLDGTIARELKNDREWTERETKDREAHQTELATLRAQLEAKEAELAMLQREMAGAIDNEQERWQDMLDRVFQMHVQNANIDGGGCESGDPLEFSESELHQAFQHLESQNDKLRAEVEARQTESEALQRIITAIDESAPGLGLPNPIDNAESKLQKLIQDQRRLDWLEVQARNSPTGISFDWVPSCEGDPSGFRFMRRFFIGSPARKIRDAIDYANEDPEFHSAIKPTSKPDEIARLAAEVDAVRKAQCPKCGARMELVCDPTGQTDFYHCFRCDEADAAQARCGELERELLHQRGALMIYRDRQGGTASHADITVGIDRIDALLTPSQQPDKESEDDPEGVFWEHLPEALSKIEGGDALCAKPEIQSNNSPVSNPQPESPIPSGVGQPSRPEPVKAGEWLPMESAPFIENEIGPTIILRGSFIVAGDLSKPTTEIGYSNGRRGKFSVNALPFRATHWQPLPSPPIAPEGKATEGEG